MNKENNMENTAISVKQEQADEALVLKESKADNTVTPAPELADKAQANEKTDSNELKTGEKPAAKKKKEPDFFNTKKTAGGLQGHFERFRKAKKQDIKYRNYVSQ